MASVTSDLSGFGQFFKKEVADKEFPGVYIMERMGKSNEHVVGALADVLYHYTLLSRRERVENKIAAYRLAARADWSIFIRYYFAAHAQALLKL